MKESTKNGYVASGAILFVGIIFGYAWFTAGKDGLVGIISIISSLLGIGGILKPDFIGQILDHWLKKQQGVNQNQYKPNKSPQTGTIHGNQNIYYNGDKEDKLNFKYNKEKIEKRLKDIKTKLGELKSLDHHEGNKDFSPLKKEVKGIIHKIYFSNPEVAEKRLIHKPFFIITESTPESSFQEWYREDVEGLIDTIEVILNEMNLD